MQPSDQRRARAASVGFRVRARSGVAMGVCMLALAGSTARAWACPPASNDPIAQLDGKPDGQPDGKPAPTPEQHQPRVRIALLLDTSNSMDGLIAQAKSQLWTIVRTFDRCTRNGQRPTLEVALYQYGNDSLSEGSSWVQQVSPFTRNLDLLSERLFGLSTSGGREHCGAVIDRAAQDLDWTNCPGDLAMIFIAGNEPFTQGSVRYQEAIARAAARGVRVSTIFCGPRAEGEQTGWADGARLGRGTFGVIDQSIDPTHIATPYDDELAQLSTDLSGTFMPMGDMAATESARQARVDASARPSAPVAAERAAAKAGAQYTAQAATWDLVSAIEQNSVRLESLSEEQLPPDLRGLSKEARQTRVQAALARRAQLRERVATLTAQREQHLRQQQAQQAGSQGAQASTLGDALVAEVLRAAREQGYVFER